MTALAEPEVADFVPQLAPETVPSIVPRQRVAAVPEPNVLHGLSEIRAFFRTNSTPIYFVSPTPFNLLGIDRWVRNFYFISYYDSFEGTHPRVFVPSNRPAHQEFDSIEDVCNYLLRDPEVAAFIESHGPGGKVCFVMFDEETERLAGELGLEIIHPPAALRKHIDSKVTTTRLGNEAGAPSVPNVLGHAATYDELLSLAASAGLGTDLVIQLPYGDSGRTTFFIACEQDFERYSDQLGDADFKVMKRIDNKAVAVEAAITRYGTIVGNFMVDLVGYPELTPYAGGWCGNDLFPEALAPSEQARARDLVRRFGDRLAQEGYYGFFEMDVLVDLADGEVYLGECNPRVSGASPMSHVTAAAYADMPLFLFHLLEYMGVDYELDVDEINERWARLGAQDVWSQLIIKEPNDSVEYLLQTPRTGVYALRPDGSLHYARSAHDWHGILDDHEAFFLRVYGPGDYRFKGADLGTLVTRGRLQTDDLHLTQRCRRLISGIRSQYVTVRLPERGENAATAGLGQPHKFA